MRTCDFLIIGSGIAGASLACELAARASVVILEQEERPGYHTSGRSAAMYIESYGARPVRQLTAASRAFFDAPPEGFADYPILIPRGCMTIASNEECAALDAVAAHLAETGGVFRELSGPEIRATVPVLHEATTARALLEPDSADIDVNALHQGFLRRGRAHGAELRLGARVEALERVGQGWRVRLAGGEILEAASIIDAAGAWADEVAALAGAAPMGLTPKRRTVVLLDPPPGVDIEPWPTVMGAAENFYFKPQSGLILASPCDETPSPAVDAAPEELDIAICVDRVQAVADLPVRRVAQAWAGLRTFAPDSTQVFGYDPRVDGFFWFAGQGGYGMQTAPAAARLGAALALRQPIPADLAEHGLTEALFSPARFLAS